MPKKLYVPFDEPRERLLEIERHLRDTSEGLKLFCRFLAERIWHKNISPAGFLRARDQAYSAIRKGRAKGEKLDHPLVGQTGLVYFLILTSLPKLSAAIFPPKFAEAVQALEAIRKGA